MGFSASPNWNHQTDEEYLAENSPAHFSYNDKTMNISVQWSTLINGEFTMNSKVITPYRVRKNVVFDLISKRYPNPMDFITSPEGDAIISLIASKIGVSKPTALALFAASVGYSRYKYTESQISKREMQNEVISTVMITGVGMVSGIAGGLIFATQLHYLNEGAKKLNEFNTEFEIWFKNLPKYW